MTVKNAGGAAVTKASLLAADPVDGKIPISADLFDVVTVNGRLQRRLLARAGTAVHARVIEGWYPRPVIDAIRPAMGEAAGGTTVTITGGMLAHVTAVAFGGAAATGLVVLDANTVRCVTPAHSAGPVNVVVTGASGPVTLPGAFTYATNPMPDRVVPNALPTGGGEYLTVFGAGLLTTTGVTFGGAAATDVQVAADGLSLTCLSPEHAASATGDFSDLVVATAGGAGMLPDAVFFYDPQAAPHITSIDPTSGPAGTEVTVTGRNFTAGGGVVSVAALALGAAPNSSPGRTLGTAVEVASDTELTATLDRAANIGAHDDPYLNTTYLIVPATADFEGTSAATFTLVP